MNCSEYAEITDNALSDGDVFTRTSKRFTIEEGFEYEMLVQITKMDRPTIDGSSIQYAWVKLIQKIENKCNEFFDVRLKCFYLFYKCIPAV